ncbi:FAD/NAD-P-binding domain-containing protein [Artomyces pyxidatus]|uniref:FAD/NAD-P-binding domain-containing protein n=1 Tax=Artomyces pyxidatus TaxID=48021 RepID=A0ACB8SKD9_9AGAM|nr:FAD/NAD-P-binding domain-containing protein [Artomyces pyxidatus]
MDADGNFDVVIFGTGITESIAAAALSKAGLKVAHLDSNAYYGGDEASLTLEELAQWADSRQPAAAQTSPYLSEQRNKFTSITRSSTIPDHPRQYSVSLAPSLITSVGPLITSLVSSGVSRYGGYRLLERVGLYDSAVGIRNVPGSKEDVFKSQEMSLLDKRRLMRFLMFASGDFEDKKELLGHQDSPFIEFLRTAFSLGKEVSEAIAYALAFCTSSTDPTLTALQRLRSYLRSSGRYGSSPFLVGHYGGLGEIAQGFCRVSAVNSGVYILDRPIRSIISSSNSVENTATPTGDFSPSRRDKYVVELEDFPEPMTADLIISSASLLPEGLRETAHFLPQQTSSTVLSRARCIAIIDRPISFPTSLRADEDPSPEPASVADTNPVPSVDNSPVDTSVVVFPPSSLEGGSSTSAVHAFITGQGSMSAPQGKYIVYLSVPMDETQDTLPETILNPYLDAILSLTVSPSPEASIPPTPLFTLFYAEHPSERTQSTSTENKSSTVLVSPPISTALSETSDAASDAAEVLFFKAIEILKARRREAWTVREGSVEAGSGGDVFEELKFWPPLDGDPEEEAGEW